MYKSLVLSALSLAILGNTAQSQVIFSDNFSYANGPLLGQGGWLITGTSVVNPLNVSGGVVNMTTTGQDANRPLNTPYTWGVGNTAQFNIGVTLNVSAAQATGDYFLHWSDGGTTTFISRLFAKSSGTGYVLGYQEASGGSPVPVYGSQILSYGQSYDVLIKYQANAGLLNDTAEVFVNNLSYVSDMTWAATGAELGSLVAINLRQGTAANAPTLSVDNLFIQVVPEPTSAALFGIGLAGLLIARRRS